MIYKRLTSFKIGAVIAFLGLLSSCEKDVRVNERSFSCGTPYTIPKPPSSPPMPIPEDNPTTLEGIELGRHLFYEKMLSGDNTLACAGCHLQSEAFTDVNKFSIGINGFVGGRVAMPIANLAYSPKLFWDGKANSLEELVLFPIQSEVEMHESVFRAVRKLQDTEKYPGMFYKAFCDSTITVENMSKAMAQFMRSITSFNPNTIPGIGENTRNEVQQRGFEVFTDETKGDCFHCHTVTAFTTNFTFQNNGLNEDPTTAPGLFGQTGDPADMGKFKVPQLINLRHTAPYMHDGRFETLQEVIEFYDTGFHVNSTLSGDMLKHVKDGKPVPRAWTERDKLDLLAFLLTLEDTTILNNPKWSDPNE
ncbi:MAG: cytochrome-c peroxidase [Bacteroidia bacterium]|nr:cytochrome-c peroxidase [Bacteroidia bacterium]